MLEQEFHIAKLISAELEGRLSQEQAMELQAWKDAAPDHLAFYNNFVARDNFLQEFKNFSQINTDHIWQLTEAGLKENLVSATAAAGKRIKLWPRIAGIAAVVAALALCIYFFNAPQSADTSAKSDYGLAAADVKPGRNGATITLAGGKVIPLSDRQSGVVIGTDRLAYTDGTAVSTEKVLRDQKITATTAKGQTYNFTLPDGTRVWLNADSKISFAQYFKNSTREVFLEGEAYFEVTKDKRHPFIVSSKGQQIEVLGTHFNVNSYIDELATTTTLLEGTVRVNAGGLQKVIKPGEQAVNRAGAITVQQADLDNVMDWKNGDFFLNHVEFKTAMRKIARWYDMEVIYDESVPDNMESGGWISRNKPLSAVLKSIEVSGLVKFKVEGRRIYVTQ